MPIKENNDEDIPKEEKHQRQCRKQMGLQDLYHPLYLDQSVEMDVALTLSKKLHNINLIICDEEINGAQLPNLSLENSVIHVYMYKFNDL